MTDLRSVTFIENKKPTSTAVTVGQAHLPMRPIVRLDGRMALWPASGRRHRRDIGCGVRPGQHLLRRLSAFHDGKPHPDATPGRPQSQPAC